jgi:hypothetical protein
MAWAPATRLQQARPKISEPQQIKLLTMHTRTHSVRPSRRSLAVLAIVLATGAAHATDAAHGIEQALAAALQDKRGITVYVAGQAIGGAVTRIEPGQWVELKNQTSGKIIVRLDRIDGIAAP